MKNNNIIQDLADNTLRNKLLEITSHSDNIYFRITDLQNQKDKGIDFDVEIEDSSTLITHHKFSIQNKGSANPSKFKKNSFSWQMHLRNINYYRNEIPQCIILTFCDTTKEEIFWYAIQLDDEIETKIDHAQKKGKKSIMLSIDKSKRLSLENLAEFLQDIRDSHEEQQLRFEDMQSLNKFIDGNNAMETILNNKNIVDQLHNLFHNTNQDFFIIPKHILKNSFPFKVAPESITRYYDFTLTTDNKEILDLIKDLLIRQTAECSSDKNDKTNYLLDKLAEHLIHRIQLYKTNEIVEVPKPKNARCTCLLCSLKKFDLINIAFELGNQSIELTSELKLSYLYYELDNLHDTTTILINLHRRINRSKNPILYAIVGFNLKKLETLLTYRYLESKANIAVKDELLEYNKTIKKKLKILETRNPSASWVLTSNFFLKKKQNVSKQLMALRKTYDIFLRGGWSSNNYLDLLINEYADIYNFIYGNHLIYMSFIEFKETTEEFIEGILISHKLDNNFTEKLEVLDDWLLSIIVNYGESEYIIKIFQRYQLTELKIEQDNFKDSYLSDLLKNLFSQIDSKSLQYLINAGISPNLVTNRRISVIRSSLTLISLSNLDEQNINEITNNLLNYLTFENKRNIPIRGVETLFINKGYLIKKETLERTLTLALETPEFHNARLIEIILETLLKKHGPVKFNRKTLIELLKTISDKCGICSRKHDLYFLPTIYKCVELDTQKKIKKLVEEHLKTNFDHKQFYAFALYDMFSPTHEFFNSYLENIHVQHNPTSLKSIFMKREENIHEDICDLCNLCYKYDVDLSNSIFDRFRSISPFYEWLFNLSGFNYDNFDPLWLFECETIYYFKEFKKHYQIRTALIKYLRHSPHQGLHQLLLQLLD